MEWFFALDFARSHQAVDAIKVAVTSAKENTSLDPHCLYEGERSDILDWLIANHVKIHTPDDTMSHAASFSLKPFFLYTICDVMFRGEIEDVSHPKLLAAKSDGRGGFDSSVMIVNARNFRQAYDSLVVMKQIDCSIVPPSGAYDQVFLNLNFLNDRTDLDDRLNMPLARGLSGTDALIINFNGRDSTAEASA